MWTCPKCAEQIEEQFDSCWKCASQAEPIAPPRPVALKWFNYLFAAFVAFLLPLSSVGLHVALSVLSGAHRVEVDQFAGNLSNGYFWVWMLVPAAITFIVLLPFLKYDFARRVVAIALGVIWTYLVYANT